MKKKIGISMRITKAKNYIESRDSISQDWLKYSYEYHKNFQFIYIPNIGKKVIDYIKFWNIDSIVFSGGDDFGKTPIRDITETTLLKYALINNIPVLGICRGLQLIVKEAGGKIIRGDENFINRHTAANHNVIYNEMKIEVNSYHSNKIIENQLPPIFNIIAREENDGSIEAVSGKNILGFMWHPEREIKQSSVFNKLINNHFESN